MKKLKVALIHDWLVGKFGAENVFAEIIKIFPNSEIFTLIDVIPNNKREFIAGKKVHQSFIAKLPFAKNHFRKYLGLMPIAIEQFDFADFDLIISSSTAVAKGVIPKPNQLHICYINSPIRYAWDLEHQYIKESNIKGLKKLYVKNTLHKIRNWDVISSNRVDYFIADSSWIQSRVKKYYRRESEILNPNVDIEYFSKDYLKAKKQDYFFTIARHVPYKKIDIIIRAFNQMPDKKLIIGGSGEETERLKQIANNNIEFTGFLDQEKLRQYLQEASAFIYAALEDFGIVMAESLAAGTPVIAYGVGGSCDIIADFDKYKTPTGILFNQQNETSLIEAVEKFTQNKTKFHAKDCYSSVTHLSAENFRKKFEEIVLKQLKK